MMQRGWYLVKGRGGAKTHSPDVRNTPPTHQHSTTTLRPGIKTRVICCGLRQCKTDYNLKNPPFFPLVTAATVGACPPPPGPSPPQVREAVGSTAKLELTATSYPHYRGQSAKLGTSGQGHHLILASRTSIMAAITIYPDLRP